MLHGDSSLSYTVKNTVLHCELKEKFIKLALFNFPPFEPHRHIGHIVFFKTLLFCSIVFILVFIFNYHSSFIIQKFHAKTSNQLSAISTSAHQHINTSAHQHINKFSSHNFSSLTSHLSLLTSHLSPLISNVNIRYSSFIILSFI